MTQEPNIFPYIARLLQGAEVVWKPLGEIASMYGGLTGKNKTDFEEGNASYITYKNIFDNIEVDFDKLEKVKISPSEKQNKVRYGDVLFTGSSETAEDAGMSSAITTTIEEDIYLNSFSFGIRFNEDVELIPEFSKYLFRSHFMRAAISKTASGVTRFNISKERLKKLSIPLPPLSVQQEIVRILDKFTQLEAELEAELDCRKRQYEYYRDMLLTSDEKQVEWKTLGEVAEVVTDFTAAGSFASNAKNVKYLKEPNYALLVRTTDLKKVFKNNEDFIYVDKHAFEYLWRVNLDKESIILPNVGNCGEVYYSIPQRLPYDNCVLGPNAILLRSCIVNNKYLYYLFQADDFQKDLSKITSTTGQTKFNKTNLKQIKIPIPPIEEQERIAGILDKFDTLVNSISEGLPREIELRRKQYEYYREKLLSFPTE